MTRNACKTTARPYYEVVVLRHPSEWEGPTSTTEQKEDSPPLDREHFGHRI